MIRIARFCFLLIVVCSLAPLILSGLQAQTVSKESPKTISKTVEKGQSTKKSKNSPAQKTGKDVVEYDAYKGVFYGLYVPKGWTQRPSLRDEKNNADDSIFFTAPDSSAEFYVYCPRYIGKPTDIEIDRKNEDQISQTIEEKDGVRIRTARIKAKDGSYKRVFEDTIGFMAGRRLTFGFKYRDDAALVKYDPVYVYFKSSFRKFVD